MQYMQLPGVSKPISRLVQGTTMVRSHTLDYSFQLLDDIFALGCNTFDTAHVYGDGDVERTLGRWIHERGVGDEVVIMTKGAHHNEDRPRVTPYDITSDLFDTFARMKVDSIALFVLHRDDPSVPTDEIMDVLHAHQQAGRIQAYGASNWTHERIQQANVYAASQGYAPFVLSSVQYSLAEMVIEPWPNCVSIGGESGQSAREWYTRTQLPVFAWSSLAAGMFSGRFRRDNLDSFENYHDQMGVKAYAYEANFQRYERAMQLGKEKGFTAAQIALAYVLNQPMEVVGLVGCRSKQEFVDNSAALDIDLTPEEMVWLERGAN